MQSLRTPTNLDRAAATVLHQIADVSRLNAGSDERSDVVMVQLRQLHTRYEHGLSFRHNYTRQAQDIYMHMESNEYSEQAACYKTLLLI